jgi:hypothetical protein
MSNHELTAEERTDRRATYEAFEFAVCGDREHVNVSNVSHGSENASEHTYTVTVWDSPVSCTCPDYKYRHRCCKHMRAVEANDAVMMAATTDLVTDGGTADEDCHACGGTGTTDAGQECFVCFDPEEGY